MGNLELKERTKVSLKIGNVKGKESGLTVEDKSPELAIKEMKLKLIEVIAQVVNKKYKTQKQAGASLGIDQPKISMITRSKIEGFSLSYLLKLLVVLDQDVKIEIKDSSESS